MTETQRVAIVTGAAGGIGRAMARGLLAAGIRVAGVDRDREPLEALAAMAREQGKAAELLTIQTDLSSDSAAEQRAPGLAASTFLSTMPGSVRARSGRIVGSARSNSGRSRPISGAASSRSTRQRRGRS